jgi:hypothetical protein
MPGPVQDGGDDVFEGSALGGVVVVDASFDPDAGEDLGLDGLDAVAYGQTNSGYDGSQA